MINQELVKSYVNQLDAIQAKKLVLEFINHFELNEEYIFNKVIDNVITIVNKSSKIIDRMNYIDILKENQTLFTDKETKVISNSVKIIGYDNILGSVKIAYTVEGNTYPFYTNVDIDKLEEQETLNNLKSTPL